MLSNISIAAPAYNEAANLRPLVEEWTRHLQKTFPDGDHEIVICDDGSRDDTAALLDQLAREHPALRPCHHAVNLGAAAALATAIRHTTRDWVLLLDTDGQYPIDNLELLRAELQRAPAQAFIGCRDQKADSTFARFGSWLSGACCNLAHGTRYRDFNCALKLVRGPLLRSLTLEARGLNYSTEISSRILERGIEMREVPIRSQPRRAGRSSRTLVRGTWERLLFVAYIGWRQILFKSGVLRRQTQPPC